MRKFNIPAHYENHETVRIEMPRNLSTDLNSYNFFSFISEHTKRFTQENIQLDFFHNEYLDVNSCSILASLINELHSKYNIVEILNLSPETDRLLIENKFFQTVFNEYDLDIISYNSKMPCLSFLKNESSKFVEYLDEGLLSMVQLPKMTSKLKKIINERLLEIFSNAHEHGSCKLFYSSGEYSLKKGKITITLANTGKTIRENVNECFNIKISAIQALNWAVEEGNTTRKGNIPGGLGISLLREFLFHNNGYLEIVSENGLWQERDGKITTHTLNFRFSGTIVNIVININDNKYYKLASE
ncbi:MAG: hypothetical protein U0T11_04725 [Chitinophagaceae bacterium]